MGKTIPIAICAFVLTAFPALAQFPGARDFERRNDSIPNHERSCVDLHASVESRIRNCEAQIGIHGDAGGTAEETLLSLYLATDTPEDALSHLNDMLAKTPGDIAAERTRMLVYARLAKLNEALADSNDILRITHDDFGARSNLCWIRGIAGRALDQALADCNSALAEQPNDASTLEARALVSFKQNNLQSALIDYDAVLKQFPERMTALYGRGVVKKRLGDAAGGDADINAANRKDASAAGQMLGYGISP
jgi:tetratricopeptide (TPR) repeat protein